MAGFEDPLEAAKRRMNMFKPDTNQSSFFPAADLHRFSEQSDLLKDAEDSFYGGVGAAGASPTPTPTPTPTPRSYFGGGQFPVTNFQNTGFQTSNGFGMNARSILGRPPQYDQFNQLYGWT